MKLRVRQNITNYESKMEYQINYQKYDYQQQKQQAIAIYRCQHGLVLRNPIKITPQPLQRYP